MTRQLAPSRSPFATQACNAGCGEQVRLVRLVRDVPTKGDPTYVPLVVGYPTYHGDVPASHALSAGRKTCRQLRRGERPDPTEHAALIHHAVCSATRPAPSPVYSITADDIDDDGDLDGGDW